MNDDDNPLIIDMLTICLKLIDNKIESFSEIKFYTDIS